VILEAPTGFGKSPTAMAVALAEGSSYTCTATKDLQNQYAKDFPFLRMAKGKNNFICVVKEDFIKNGTHRCMSCLLKSVECCHTSAEYGPCKSNKNSKTVVVNIGCFEKVMKLAIRKLEKNKYPLILLGRNITKKNILNGRILRI
jgi:Rad3-related DNA helicase